MYLYIYTRVYVRRCARIKAKLTEKDGFYISQFAHAWKLYLYLVNVTDTRIRFVHMQYVCWL